VRRNASRFFVLFDTALPSDAESAVHLHDGDFTPKDYTFRRAAQSARRAAQIGPSHGAIIAEDAPHLCSRAQKCLERRKNAARLATSVKNPRFYSLLLLLTGDDFVRLNSPWAIRPYANQ
jgi:hypothetical protein